MPRPFHMARAPPQDYVRNLRTAGALLWNNVPDGQLLCIHCTKVWVYFKALWGPSSMAMSNLQQTTAMAAVAEPFLQPTTAAEERQWA